MSGAATGPVVVIGGSGAVGRAVARSLAATGDREIIVTARDGCRARECARALGPTVTGAELDVDDWASVRPVVDRADLVVVCVERANARIAGECLARGVSYLDVSATTEVLDAIRAHHGSATTSGAAALVSVGVAPGLTNLLARLCHRARPTASAIDLTLCFGLRGDAGPESRRWVIDGLATSRPAARPLTVALPELGRRRAHWFPFSDQRTIADALGIPVTTRLCFESRLVTRTVFAARRAGLYASVRRLGGGPALDRILGSVRLGTDRFVVHARARDAAETTVEASVAGRGECRVTGRVAAAAARRLLEGSVPPGVHDLDAVVDAAPFLAEVGDDLVVRTPAVAAGPSPARMP